MFSSFFFPKTVGVEVIPTDIALPICKIEKTFFISNIIHEGTITCLIIIMSSWGSDIFKCYPNFSLIGVGAQTLKGGKINLVTTLIDNSKALFNLQMIKVTLQSIMAVF